MFDVMTIDHSVSSDFAGPRTVISDYFATKSTEYIVTRAQDIKELDVYNQWL